MSNPGPPNWRSEDERSDYAPSDSEPEDVYDQIDKYDDVQAFRDLPSLGARGPRILQREQAEFLDITMEDDGRWHKVVPAWTVSDDDPVTSRRPALLPDDESPSIYARYVCFPVPSSPAGVCGRHPRILHGASC